MSLLRKSLILIGLVVGGLVIGQLILTGLMFAGGADFNQADDINALIGSMENTMPFKIGIGLNNIIMFGLSAYIFKLIVSKEKFSKYFSICEIIFQPITNNSIRAYQQKLTYVMAVFKPGNYSTNNGCFSAASYYI